MVHSDRKKSQWIGPHQKYFEHQLQRPVIGTSDPYIAGSREAGVDSVSTVVLFFLSGRKVVKSQFLLFFEGPGFFLGEGLSGRVRAWDLALVCGLETEPVRVLFLLRMGGDGGVRGSSLGTEIVEPADSAKRGDSAVGSTGGYGVLSCCPSWGVSEVW